jgi:argininosuccinate lyase
MPGYTHLQPAQPITFGWYLLGIAHAMERDHRRIAECFARIDLNPLGTGAVAGTSFPVDRALTARLLGFAGVCGHAQDAVASRDFLTELVGGAAMLANTWAAWPGLLRHVSYERPLRFRTVSPHLQHDAAEEEPGGAGDPGSSAPPPKGAQVAALSGAGTNHQHVDGSAAFRWVWEALEDTARGLAVAEVVVASAEPEPERMLALARANFSTATDLADGLVREAGLPFREAHHLVGAIVRTAMERGLTADRIDAALIAEEAERMLGHRIDLPAAVVARIVDPVAVAEGRQGSGGPSTADMAAMQAALGARLEADRAEAAGWRARIEAADAERRRLFHALAAAA